MLRRHWSLLRPERRTDYGVQIPVEVSIFQLVLQVIETVVPLIVSGCQMYRESVKLVEFQRSPRNT